MIRPTGYSQAEKKDHMGTIARMHTSNQLITGSFWKNIHSVQLSVSRTAYLHARKQRARTENGVVRSDELVDPVRHAQEIRVMIVPRLAG